MAKSGVKKWIPGGIALVLGLVAFCMIFTDAVVSEYSDNVGVKGTWLAFGHKEHGFEITKFNFGITLAYFLPLVGGILALITGNGFLMKIITTACFAIGAALLFSVVAMADIESAALSASTIVAAVLSILGAVVCFFKGTIAKKIGG